MERFDAIIVGGGPAGSTCGWHLNRLGMNAVILDKKLFPRDKPCAGWITPQVLKSLDLDVDEYRQGRTWQPLCGFRCGTIGGNLVGVDYGKPVSYGILRTEFDEYLLRRSGVELRLGESATGLNRQGEDWIVNDRYIAPMLVGAGGNFCPVARLLGADAKSTIPQVVAQEVEFRSAKSMSISEDDRPALYFCPDLLGYGWCFRKGDYVNIGLGRTNKHGFSSHLELFREFLNANEVPVTQDSGKWRGHAYRLFDRVQPKLLDKNVVLIGDSAGLADYRSGEGIRCAIESGLMAAEVISDFVKTRDVQHLAKYQVQLLARFGNPRPASHASWLPTSWMESLSSMLLTNRWFAKKFVLDQWFLHRNLPAFTVRSNA